jgi:hypothetical protein
MAVPKSSITNAPEVAMTAPMIQHIKAIPTLPDVFKIPDGVEKILHPGISSARTMTGEERAYPAPTILLTMSDTAPKSPIVRSCRIFSSLMFSKPRFSDPSLSLVVGCRSGAAASC